MDIEIKLMTEEDVLSVWMVEKSSFSQPWSQQSFMEELKNSLAKYFVAYADKQVVGYVGMWEISGQCDITNIAVIPEFRRMGIAKALLLRLIDYCKKKNLSPITLEVRASNEPALQLYSTMGFENIGFRKKYYQDTGEDALIMALDLPQ